MKTVISTIIDKKKTSERFIVEKFISNANLKLKVFSIVDNETPDFIIKTIEKDISIELTQLINPKLKAQETLNNQIVEGAKELFTSKYKEKLGVLVTFASEGITCRKTEIPEYSEKLFRIVENIYINNRNFKFEVSSRKSFEPNNFIKHIYVDNKFNNPYWQTIGAYLVDYLDFNILEKIIKSKEKNLIKYGDSYKENWLLITSNFGTKSSAKRFDFINQFDLKTTFDKIYIYKFFENKIIEYK